MNQAHACLNFIAMLTTWAAGNEELQVTIALQRFTVGRIRTHNNYHLLAYHVYNVRISLRFKQIPMAKVRTIIIIPKASQESRIRLVASAWL